MVVTERRWYGWQLLISDAAGVALLVTSFSEHIQESPASGPLVGASLGILALGGPAIHLAHGRWQAALGSLGLRVGSAVLGALVGAALGSRNNSNPDADVPPGLVGGIFGFGFGAIVGMGVDDCALAWERVPVNVVSVHPPGDDFAKNDEVASPHPSQGLRLSLSPIAGPKQAGMGIVGSF
jgi:hypothetical protein